MCGVHSLCVDCVLCYPLFVCSVAVEGVYRQGVMIRVQG